MKSTLNTEKVKELAAKVRNGVPMLPKRDEEVTLEHVQAIMDEADMEVARKPDSSN